MFTPEQQTANLIRLRDELQSGRWQKFETGYANAERTRFCAYGVALECDIVDRGEYRLWSEMANAAMGLPEDIDLAAYNDDNPGDNFAAVIEVLNEEIMRRTVASAPSVAEELVLA